MLPSSFVVKQPTEELSETLVLYLNVRYCQGSIQDVKSLLVDRGFSNVFEITLNRKGKQHVSVIF